MSNKESHRKLLREKRTSLSRIQQQQKSQTIINYVLKSEVFKEAKTVGYYHAVKGEADPANLSTVHNIRHKQKQFYLPVVVPASKSRSKGLVFAPVSPKSQYQPNLFNIPEPICKQSEIISADQLDLLIMPLLGFDRIGNRLGMGGGYYDRSLEFKHQQSRMKPILMGFAYDFQEVESLQAEDWDISLDWIATESGIIKCV